MKVFRIITIFVLLSVIAAQPQKVLNAISPVEFFPPDSKPYGIPYNQLGKVWMEWAIKLPYAEGPNGDGPRQDCIMGETDSIIFLINNKGSGVRESDCTIPTNKSILFPVLFEECDYGSVPSPTDAQLIECADFRNPNANIIFTVDGNLIYQGVHKNYENYARSDFFNLNIPEDNLFGASGSQLGSHRALIDGTFMITHPLAAGSHEIIIKWTQLADSAQATGQVYETRDIIYRINVTDS